MDVNFFDCVGKKEHVINIEEKEYFWNIYKKIKKKWKNQNEFTLIFEGKIINKYNRVSEYGINNGSTVILLQQQSSYFTGFNSTEHNQSSVFPRSYFTSRRRRPRSRRARFQSPNLTVNHPPPILPPPPPPSIPSHPPPQLHDYDNSEDTPPGLLASTSELNLISDIQTILRNVIHSETNQIDQEQKEPDNENEEKQADENFTPLLNSASSPPSASRPPLSQVSNLPPQNTQTLRTYFRSLYASQINIMTEMGFCNIDAILDALILNNGDINDSIEFF